MYSYYYEAKSIVPDISLHLAEDYAAGAQKLMIIMSIIAFACVLIAAIAHKKSRPIGIIAAIMQPVGFFAGFKYVLAYSEIDFSCLGMTVTSSVSLDDAMNKLRETLSERIATDIMPGLFATMPWSLLMLASFIFTLVYVAIIMKDKNSRGKGLAVTALILSIIRYVFFSPINMFALFLGNATSTTQTSWDPVYYIFCMIPIVLIGIKGLASFGSKPAPVAEAPATEAEPAAEDKPE